MNNAILVAVDGTDSNDYLMERAVERAQLEDAALVVAHVIPTARFEDRQRAIAANPDLRADGFTYTADQARAEAEAVAARAAHAAVGGLDVPCATVGAVGEPGPTLLAIADEHGCGTIVLAEERSWWRRRLARGDRKIARAFDGRVVRVPRRAPGIVADPPVVDA